MNEELLDFEDFMLRRAEAASAYVEGEAGPVAALAAETDPASFFHPGGAVVSGAAAVRRRYLDDAGSFAPGGETRFEILHLHASGGLAYWTGYQHARAILGGKTIPMRLRITEIFRREAEGWKLIHRHADSPPQKGE